MAASTGPVWSAPWGGGEDALRPALPDSGHAVRVTTAQRPGLRSVQAKRSQILCVAGFAVGWASHRSRSVTTSGFPAAIPGYDSV